MSRHWFLISISIGKWNQGSPGKYLNLTNLTKGVKLMTLPKKQINMGYSSLKYFHHPFTKKSQSKKIKDPIIFKHVFCCANTLSHAYEVQYCDQNTNRGLYFYTIRKNWLFKNPPPFPLVRKC